MSYPAFLVIALTVTSVIAIAVAGPLSALCVICFWIAHYFFVQWRLDSAPLSRMSDRELDSLHSDWTRGVFWHSVTHISAIRIRRNDAEMARALKRLIAILEEKIQRAETSSADCATVNNLRGELENFSKELRHYLPSAPIPEVAHCTTEQADVDSSPNQDSSSQDSLPKLVPMLVAHAELAPVTIPSSTKSSAVPHKPPTNRRKCLDDFSKYIENLEKTSKVETAINQLAANPKKLSLQSASVKAKMAHYVEEFADSLSDEQYKQYKNTLVKILNACATEM